MPLPVFDQAQYEFLLAQRRKNAAAQLSQGYNINEAEQGALGGEANLISARRRANQAKLGTIGASAGVTMASRGVNAANVAVLGREQEQLGATRGLISLSQQQAGARQQDVSLIRGARDNVADKVAVAKEGQARGVEDARLYGRLGVDAPVDVDVPAGQGGGAVGLGQRASLKTQEMIVRGQAADREADRAATLENAKLAVQMQATNVTEAELMARRAGLSLAEARLMVDDAQLQEQLAGVDVTEAGLRTNEDDLGIKGMRLGRERTQLAGSLNTQYMNDMNAPTDQGYEIYTDPVTRQREWLTPAEADDREYEYQTSLSQRRMPRSVSLEQSRREATQQAAAARDPLYGFDEGDYVEFLIPGLPAGVGDPSQPQENNLLAQIAASYRAKGMSDSAISTKLIDIRNKAAVERARRADKAYEAQAIAEAARKAAERKAKGSSGGQAPR